MYMYVITINIKGTTEFEEGVWKGLQKKNIKVACLL